MISLPFPSFIGAQPATNTLCANIGFIEQFQSSFYYRWKWLESAKIAGKDTVLYARIRRIYYNPFPYGYQKQKERDLK